LSLDAWAAALVAYGPVGVGVGMFLESAAIPLPSELILPFAGFLVAGGHLSWADAMAVALAGGTAGGLVSYWVGRYGGRPVLARWGRLVRVGERELAAAERWFGRYGDRAVFWGRLLPGVRTYISLPAGVAAMPVWRFLAYSLLGSIPWTAALVAAGAVLGARWGAVLGVFHRVDVAVAALLLAALAWWWLAARRRRGRALP
jgi:membrane protein DedA with SNARE-associated domain